MTKSTKAVDAEVVDEKKTRSRKPADKPQLPARTVTLEPQQLIKLGMENNSPVEVMTELFELAKRVDAEQARKSFHRSLAAFKLECPEIKKTKKGRFGMYAPLDRTLPIIEPILAKHALALTFKTVRTDDGPWKIARLSHEDGHVDTSECPIIVDQAAGQRSDDGSDTINAMQKFGIADTYAERYSAEAVLGLAPTSGDSDGGSPKTVPQPRRQSRASAPAADGPPPPGENAAPPKTRTRAAKPTEAAPEPSGDTVLANVLEVSENSGNTNGKAWTKYTASCSDGKGYSTFSDSVAEALKLAVESQDTQAITWRKGRFGRDIVGDGITPYDGPPDEG